LKEYAHRHDLAVVVTNHVSDVVRDDDETGRRGGGGGGGGGGSRATSRQRRLYGPSGDVETSGRRVAPSLGLLWANCVNARLFLSRSRGGRGGAAVDGACSGGGMHLNRRVAVVFAPHLPRSVGGGGDGGDDGAREPCDFEVRDDGVWGIGGDGDGDGDGDGAVGGAGDERRRRRRRREDANE
jgi:DNA-repair protein XRCC3